MQNGADFRSVVAECGDGAFYCRTFYNGVQNPDGDPDPIDKTKLTMPGFYMICTFGRVFRIYLKGCF